MRSVSLLSLIGSLIPSFSYLTFTDVSFTEFEFIVEIYRLIHLELKLDLLVVDFEQRFAL